MTAEDQKSLNESIEIAEKAASDIQRTGRGTYFVSENPFEQYLDQFLSKQGREAANLPRRTWDRVPSPHSLATIKAVHDHLVDNYAEREGVSFDYSQTGGCAAFALGMKRNAKWAYLRFEQWRGPSNHLEETDVPTLYLLKSPNNGYEVPELDGVICCQSRHSYEFFMIRLCCPHHFNDEVRRLIEESFEVRNQGLVTQERKQKAELVALHKRDCEKYRGLDDYCSCGR